MSAAVWILLAALAIPVLLLIAALVTPVKLGCVARSAPGSRLTVVARLFGGLTPPIPIHDSTRRYVRKTPPPTKQKKKEKKASHSRQDGARVRRVIAAPQLLVDLLRPIHIERLAIDADIGLSDPAGTGQLYGLLTPLIYSGSPASAVSIAVRPDFSGPRLTGEIVAELSFIPVAFLPPAIRLAWRAFGPYS